MWENGACRAESLNWYQCLVKRLRNWTSVILQSLSLIFVQLILATHNPENTVTNWKAIQCRKKNTQKKENWVWVWCPMLFSMRSSLRSYVETFVLKSSLSHWVRWGEGGFHVIKREKLAPVCLVIPLLSWSREYYRDSKWQLEKELLWGVLEFAV